MMIVQAQIDNSSSHSSSTTTIINPKIAATASIALLSSKFRLVVPPAIRDMATLKAAREIGHQYEPSDVDIFCGRGKGFYNRPGNKSFRTLVGSYIPAYLAARTKVDKSAVLNTIVDKVRGLHDPITGRPAQFIKFSKKTGWVEIGDEQAREKVGHAMREAISTVEEGTTTAAGADQRTVVSTSTSSSSNKPINKAKASRKATTAASHNRKATTTAAVPSKQQQQPPLLTSMMPIDSFAAVPNSGKSSNQYYLPMESINISSCKQTALTSMMIIDGVDPEEDLDEQYLDEFARQQQYNQPSSTSTTTINSNTSGGSTFLWGSQQRGRRGSASRSSFLSGRDSMSSEMMRAAIESFIGI